MTKEKTEQPRRRHCVPGFVPTPPELMRANKCSSFFIPVKDRFQVHVELTRKILVPGEMEPRVTKFTQQFSQVLWLKMINEKRPGFATFLAAANCTSYIVIHDGRLVKE